MTDETMQGTPDLARVTELIKLADRLGLTWGLRPGTVVSVSMPYNPREASVRMDGDTNASITVVSLINDLHLGDRIMVMWVPPAGQYAVGWLDAPSTQSFAAASTANTGTITTETIVLTIPSATLALGTVYRVECGPSVVSSTLISSFFRVRKTNIAGAVWATSSQFLGGGAAFNQSCAWISYITPTIDITASAVVLTMTCTGAGAVFAGSAAAPRFFSITPVGRASDYPQAVAVT